MFKKFIKTIKENDAKKKKEDEEKKDNLIRAFKFLGDSEKESIDSANTIIRLKTAGKYLLIILTSVFAAYIIHDVFFKN